MSRAVVEGSGFTPMERHRVGRTVAVDKNVEAFTECVDHRRSDTVQPARCRVGTGPELATRMQFGEHHFDARKARARFNVDRDSSTRVMNLDAAIGVKRDAD
ncbi:unannotated protein [freshwater metagenome]|uniref:Unannotated protein n=1 Tax=freshwater metagenome TaxID=449393 RepID=A0A6J7CT23_9ZZZZ